MLLFAADHPILPVDARISRVGLRLRLRRAGRRLPAEARSVQQAVTQELPSDVEVFGHLSFLYLSHHGAATCPRIGPALRGVSTVERVPKGKSRVGRAGRSLCVQRSHLLAQVTCSPNLRLLLAIVVVFAPQPIEAEMACRSRSAAEKSFNWIGRRSADRGLRESPIDQQRRAAR